MNGVDSCSRSRCPMLAFKIAIYVLTFAMASFFGFWELKLKRQLTDELLDQQHKNVSDIDSFYELRRDIRRERVLKSLLPEVRFKLRLVMSLKLVFAVALVIAVLILQR
jgi:hypothetical protein